MVSRRSFLIGGLAGVAVAGGGTAALVEAEVLPGRVRLDRMLGRCGTMPAPPPAPGVVNTMAFGSRHRGFDVTATVVLPAGRTSSAGLPVAVALHGNGETGASVASALALDHYLTDAVASRNVPPFALVAVDGGANTYWHARRSGDDPITMITDELLPRLARQGARVDRFGVIGWSMGGYGALVLAETVGARRVAAAVASSPALFASYDEARATNHHAFDDAADFTHNNIFGNLDRLRAVPTRVDCGNSDPFAPMTRRLRGRLHPAGAMSTGCHDQTFWRTRLPDQLTFLSHHLA